MKKVINQYTMSDTGEVFDLPGCKEKIYELTITLTPISGDGVPSGIQRYSLPKFHLKESTLQKAGMRAFPKAEKNKGVVAEETPEDLLIRLLESVGVWENQ